jgi:hypothetical protein
MGIFGNKNSSVVIVNGKKYTGSGDIQITNGKVLIGGKDVTKDLENELVVNIEVHGDATIDADCCERIIIDGNASTVKTMSGNVSCANVEGKVETQSGDIHCGDVKGDVKTMSGDVTAKSIMGKVSTMSGDIKR